ncbi:response regulator [Oscillatoriales cyanobacterium LEGE 11467]|uniref:histidine kinase n=2 Tax=Zarconia TaxID=2992130 RepID=A0A928VZJ0_9CYAN|nr:response regulator [Zarconia navalis LEGE 11467]
MVLPVLVVLGLSLSLTSIDLGDAIVLGFAGLGFATIVALAIASWILEPVLYLRFGTQTLTVLGESYSSDRVGKNTKSSLDPDRLLKALAQLRDSDRSAHPLLSRRSDELGQLVGGFDRFVEFVEQSFVTLVSQKEELQHQNTELQHLDRLKDLFLSSTAHELRTYFNGTIGMAESLLEETSDSPSDWQTQSLLAIASSGRRAYHFINDILDIALLKEGTIELQIQFLDLRTIVEDVLQTLQPLCGEKDRVEIDGIPASLPLVRADENRLNQIFYNLIGNAIKLTSRGTIDISAQQILENDRPSLEITISDTGMGIPQEKLARMQAFFERADSSIVYEYGGMGVGLAIVGKLVEAHGGQLQVRSTLGRGSQVTFTLPISSDGEFTVDGEISKAPICRLPVLRNSESISNPIAPLNPTPLNSNGQPPVKVMVVDDDPIHVRAIVNYLVSENYEVYRASNGIEALDALKENFRPNIILLDLVMPGMTGFEVCQKIRQTFHSHDLPIVMLTVKNQVNEVMAGLDAGANDYLTKPISKHELIARIKTHLRLSNLNSAYSRFVPSQFLKLLQKDSIVDVKLGDHIHREMSILFSDIRSFTTLSEKMSPEENFKFINSYLSRMEPEIMKNRGFIDKYIGDSIMALFSGGADDAIRAAIAMLHKLVEYNQHRKSIGYDPIQIGIGINTGSLMLGTVGGPNRMDGTVISDAVNLASRIESLTKEYGVSLLISHQTFANIENPNKYKIRLVERLKVKGKSEAVAVFEVFDGDPPTLRDAKFATRGIFEQGVLFYYGSSFRKAADCFEACLERNSDDRIAQIYLERCRKYHIT